MTYPDEPWDELREKQRHCKDCSLAGAIHPQAKPLFGKFRPSTKGLLFVFEAPNLGDTLNAGYITYDTIASTDETGRFTKELFEQELGIQWDSFQVTNAVLCLPQKSNSGGYPVKSVHLQNCAKNLRAQINLLDPIVIASVGAKALNALQSLYKMPTTTLCSVAGKEPALLDHRWLFPLFHTSRLGRGNRSEHEQRADWAALAKFAREKGVLLNE